MLFRDLTFKTPQENILYDEALLQLAEKNQFPEVMRFWESDQTFVVLGSISSVQNDLMVDAVKQDGLQVLRRCSGGGTVLLGPGCLNYTLILSKERGQQVTDIQLSYRWIIDKVRAVLKKLNIETKFMPISDIALVSNNKKISGNAQRRGRTFIMHHGTILHHFHLTLIEKYLAIPKEMPSYRHGRSHLDFVDNLSCSINEFKMLLLSEFSTQHDQKGITPLETETLAHLLKTKSILEKIN